MGEMKNSLRALRRHVGWGLGVAGAAVALAVGGSALASPGTPGSLCAGAAACPGTTALTPHNPTHYKLQVGTGGTFAIVGATDVAPGPVTVYVKSSTLGNTAVAGTAATDPTYGTTITFSYTAPANGCDTTVVAYASNGNVSNNDVIDDGSKNDSGGAAGGFAYTDASGDVIPCGGGTPPPAAPLGGSAAATPSFTRTYAWTVAKSVDSPRSETPEGTPATLHYTVTATPDAGTDSAWALAGTVSVSNPNADAVSGVDVNATVDDPAGSCSVSGGSGATVPGGGSVDFPVSCSWSAAPAAASEMLSATIAWPAQALPSATLAAGSAAVAAPVAWTDPTTVVDGTANVDDSMAGSLGAAAAGQATTFAYALQLAGVAGTCTAYDNTATLTTGTTAATSSASASTTVCVGSDLALAADATPSFTRTYGWRIAKSVDRTVVKQSGGSAVFTYTVNAAETGFADSGWAAGGTVVVSNPNDWEAVAAHVAASVDSGGACAVLGGDVTIAAGGSVSLPVSCTWSSAPTPAAGTLTVTATWDGSAAATPNGSTWAAAPVDFGSVDPTRVNGTATIADSWQGLLGSLAATDAAPFASAAYTYQRSIAVPAWNCVTYPNTATIAETGQWASQSVSVCGPAKTGALTIGYWQNKNGQAILTGTKATAGVCNVATWLRGYAPFRDLSATASCATTASWVTTVIKNASAKGAAMNAMLKAQMLATALDVYYSSASLGGDKIGAPGPIGAVAIDVSAWSGAFDGATSLTVAAMLSTAASHANAGGATWYGNLKSVQELAKNAFDDVNNERAFSG
ncbi:MAG TPA: hypothetical protein VFJ91_08535 [Gaiellaceae bacterium]|nr:hypothetical protein [Gaiellaceae bacterium]